MLSQQNAMVRWGMLAIEVVAGAWTLVHLIWSVSNITTDDYWGVALPILFLLALILAFVQYFQERPALVTASSAEQFPEPAIAKFFLASAGSAGMWFVVRMYVGAEWLLAGYEKVIAPAAWGTSGKAIAGFVAGALAKSGGAYPAVQGWYAWCHQLPRFFAKPRQPRSRRPGSVRLASVPSAFRQVSSPGHVRERTRAGTCPRQDQR